MNERENYLRAVEFREPQWIPVTVSILPATWMKYREDLERIVRRYPKLLPSFISGKIDYDECQIAYRRGYHLDNWGCRWYTPEPGLLGRIVEHPLADWKSLSGYAPPDYLKHGEYGNQDWDEIRNEISRRKSEDLLTTGAGGELFTRFYFLRGFENLMIDIARDDPNLGSLVEMITEYEIGLVDKWLELDVDVMSFHTDIGAQNGLMIHPDEFRKYFKPMFVKLFKLCRDAGVHVFLSSDGRVTEIVDDFIECGVSIHDPQVRPNTIEGIAECYGGRLCAAVDLDQQVILPFGTAEEVDSHVREVVDKLKTPAGGLMIYAEIQPTYPLENIETLFESLEAYCLIGA